MSALVMLVGFSIVMIWLYRSYEKNSLLKPPYRREVRLYETQEDFLGGSVKYVVFVHAWKLRKLKWVAVSHAFMDRYPRKSMKEATGSHRGQGAIHMPETQQDPPMDFCIWHSVHKWWDSLTQENYQKLLSDPEEVINLIMEHDTIFRNHYHRTRASQTIK